MCKYCYRSGDPQCLKKSNHVVLYNIFCIKDFLKSAYLMLGAQQICVEYLIFRFVGSRKNFRVCSNSMWRGSFKAPRKHVEVFPWEKCICIEYYFFFLLFSQILQSFSGFFLLRIVGFITICAVFNFTIRLWLYAFYKSMSLRLCNQNLLLKLKRFSYHNSFSGKINFNDHPLTMRLSQYYSVKIYLYKSNNFSKTIKSFFN